MNAILWTSADPKVWFYLENNRLLQSISQRYQLYVACSRGVENVSTALRVSQLYNAKIIECQNNLTLKGKLVMERIRNEETNYEVVIRVDLDALIADMDALLSLCKHIVGQHAMIGNQKRDGCVRGGCNAISRSVIEKIDMPVDPNPRRFDGAYSAAVRATGASILPIECFESEGWYSGAKPVWHPPKKWLRRNNVAKPDMFVQQLERIKNA